MYVEHPASRLIGTALKFAFGLAVGSSLFNKLKNFSK